MAGAEPRAPHTAGIDVPADVEVRPQLIFKQSAFGFRATEKQLPLNV
jgi:hypothetical protein